MNQLRQSIWTANPQFSRCVRRQLRRKFKGEEEAVASVVNCNSSKNHRNHLGPKSCHLEEKQNKLESVAISAFKHGQQMLILHDLCFW